MLIQGYQGSGVSHQVEDSKPVILESLVPLAGERAADGDDKVRPHQVEVHWQRTESCNEKETWCGNRSETNKQLAKC